MENKTILILADVPIWTLPGLEQFQRSGPQATWLKSLVPEFENASGLDLHWAVFSKEVKHPLVHKVYGQTFHVFPRWKKMVSMLSAYLWEVRELQKLCNKLKPDVLHAWGSEDVYGWAGSRLKLDGAKLFTLQGCLSELGKMGGSTLFRVQAFYEKPTIQRFQNATAETPQAAKLLLGIHPELKIEVIDYGVDQIFHDQKWNPCEKPILIWVGTVTALKGIREVVKAFSSEVLKHVQLQIVGEGNLENEMRELSSENVEWLGKLGREEVAARLSRAWGLLLPTYLDTGPTVVKEARVVGLPVITTTAAGASCYIDDGKSGFVLEPKNAQSIIDSVLSLTQSKEECIKMGLYQWCETKELLKSASTAEAFVELYNSM